MCDGPKRMLEATEGTSATEQARVRGKVPINAALDRPRGTTEQALFWLIIAGTADRAQVVRRPRAKTSSAAIIGDGLALLEPIDESERQLVVGLDSATRAHQARGTRKVRPFDSLDRGINAGVHLLHFKPEGSQVAGVALL